jgi:hypothetical protein
MMTEECEAKAPVAVPEAHATSGAAGIVFEISDRLHKSRWVPLAAAAWNGRTFWSIGQGSVADTARLLVGAGAPDLPWCACDVAGEVLFRGSSLWQLANAAPSRAA